MPIERQILLLEDDMIQTMLFRAAVDGVLGTVTNFTDVTDAMAIMQRSRFDLCVVDLGIFTRPGVFHHEGGNRFISGVRHKVSRTIPIIVATSDRKPASLLSSFQAGADDYVLKDEGLEKVLGRIRHWLRQLPATEHHLKESREKIIQFLERASESELDLPE